MDINALLSPYVRTGGETSTEAPQQAAVADYLDAIEEHAPIEPTADVTVEPARETVPENVTGTVAGPLAEAAEPVVEELEYVEETAGLEGFEDFEGLEGFAGIAAFEQLDAEIAAIEEPVAAYVGKHRADMPADSLSPLVPVVATHRLTA